MADDRTQDDKGLSPKERRLREAKRRFLRCENWEQYARKLWVDDTKFANADADNGYQWPNEIRRHRDVDAKPCLTINKTRQHNLQVINDARQNKPSVSIRPMSNGATYDAAQVFEGLVRHIEYISNAQEAYSTASRHQVTAGIGYIRIVTDYAGDDTFDQEIYIRRVKDPLSVYMDPDAQEADKSDARFAFVFDDISRDQFDTKYPEYKTKAPPREALGNGDGWLDEDHVRVAEYYRKVEVADELIAMTDPQTGKVTMVKASEVPKEILGLVIDDPQTRRRKIASAKIEWCLIIGDEIVEEEVWPGVEIPIIPVIGEETVIEGRMDRKGHTRALKDPQRIYNYWSSSAVEHVALQSKTPYIGPMAAFDGLETYWDQANTVNHAWLPYNAYDDAGQLLPAPQRAQPPVMATAYIQGMEVARNEIMEVSGQYQAMLGQPSNERSGKAIDARQRQGDNATYHYIDHLAMAIRRVGRILIDLVPKIYDTPRMLRILGEDGTEKAVELDPQARQAYAEESKREGEAVRRIFNPNVGKYDVESDVGPGYATKRQEAWNAFTQIVAQNKELVGVIGDLMFKNADFPGADEIAERLERMVPAQAKGLGPSPDMQKAGQIIQNMQGVITELTQRLAEREQKLKGKDQQKDIDVYEAITDRLKVLLPTIVNPSDIARMIHDLMLQEHSAGLQQVSDASAPDLAQDAAPGAGTGSSDQGNGQPPLEGAQRASDGQWYVPDQQRPGKYMMVQH